MKKLFRALSLCLTLALCVSGSTAALAEGCDIRKTERPAKGSPAGETGAQGVMERVNHKAPLPAGEPVLLPPPGHPVRAGGCFASAQC